MQLGSYKNKVKILSIAECIKNLIRRFAGKETRLGGKAIGAGILNMVISALRGLAGAIAIGLGAGMAYGLKDLLPSLIQGSTNVESTLKRGQKVRFDGRTGTIK